MSIPFLCNPLHCRCVFILKMNKINQKFRSHIDIQCIHILFPWGDLAKNRCDFDLASTLKKCLAVYNVAVQIKSEACEVG